MFGGLFQGFQEGIEGRLGKHVNLVDDVDLVFPNLRWDTDLVYQVSDIVYRVVGGCIQLKNIEGKILSFLFTSVLVDLFGQNPGAGGLAHPARTTKQQSLRQVVIFDGV